VVHPTGASVREYEAGSVGLTLSGALSSDQIPIPMLSFFGPSLYLSRFGFLFPHLQVTASAVSGPTRPHVFQ